MNKRRQELITSGPHALAFRTVRVTKSEIDRRYNYMSNSRIMMGQNGTHAQIAVEGRGTFEIAAAFKAAYLQLLRRGANEFVVDLSRCELLDSTFIGIMIGLGLRMKEQGHTVCLGEANAEIVKVLDEIGLDRLFDYKKL